MNHSVLILLACIILTVLGDNYFELASSHPAGLGTWKFVLGAALFGAPAVGWCFLMRSHSLATLGAFYAASTVVMLAAIGVLAFGERLSLIKVVALACAVMSITLAAWEGT